MSKFWDILSRKHERQLSRGIKGFRRSVATRYFTSKGRDNEEYIRRIAEGVTIDMDDSMFGDPVMIEINDRKVTQDLINSIREVDSIKIDFSKIKHVCEIGAGYGRTAYVLLKKYPHIKYTIIDIPPAIDLAKQHLDERFPGRVTFKYNTDVQDVDLFIAISVMTELSQEEFDEYFGLFKTGKYLYLKDWKKKYNEVNDRRMTKNTWSIPETWERIFWRRDPVSPDFFNALYKIQ